MKKIILLSSIILFFSSCEKVHDDSNLVCTTDCTSISGKVYTQGDTPLKNVLMKFRFQKSIGINALQTRILSKERTTNLGQYSMDFYIKDEELGEGVGGFDLYPDKNTLPGNVFYPDYSQLFYSFYDIENRNFSMQKNLYIPTLKKVKVKLSGFHLDAPGDYFNVEILLPCGFDLDEVNPETGNNHRYVNTGINRYSINQYANQPSKEFDVEFALNEPNYIKVRRSKSGVYSEEVFLVNITSNTNQPFEYSF